MSSTVIPIPDGASIGTPGAPPPTSAQLQATAPKNSGMQPIPQGAVVGTQTMQPQPQEQAQPSASLEHPRDYPLSLPSNMSVSAAPKSSPWIDTLLTQLKFETDPLGATNDVLDSLKQKFMESEHPGVQAAGQGLDKLKGFLVGGAQEGSHNIGTGKYGVVNNPVTSLIAAPGAGAEEAGVAGEELVGKTISKAKTAIPSAERAIQGFEEVKGAAGRLPIDVTEPEKVAIETQRLAKSGGRMPKVMSDWLKRTEHAGQPLSYEEARDFYSNATRLSSEEAQGLTPVMKKQVAKFTDALRTATKDAAGEAGKAETFEASMKEYAASKRMENRKEFVKDLVYQGVKNGLKYGTALWIADKLWRGEQ